MLTEWQVLKEKWFHGETIDPVFEGVVRDFCTFDETMHSVYEKVGIFMRGVEQLATGMTALSEGVGSGLTHAKDSQIASDSCKLKEATNQIARADAPHSAIAKLRRDMQFNILTPVQSHIANNRNLKVSLDIRRRRLIELTSAKKSYDDVVTRNLSHTDRRHLQAQSTYESAKMTFNDVDRHVFEWLYILEEYRGDILDSTLQTLKYLQYEFFATSAHAVSTSLPSRMEFRPMVEMTPEHLEAQVEMELQESEEAGNEAEGVGVSPIADFSARLIDKKAKEDPADDAGPSLPVDPLSLSSLLSQGFEEGPARRALRLNQNNTQAAMDWLIDGQFEESEKRKKMEDGVRMPTTVKRVQKLKAMRRAQQDKLKAKSSRDDDRKSSNERSEAVSDDSSNSGGGAAANGSTNRAEGSDKSSTQLREAPQTKSPKRTPAPDLLQDLVDVEKETPQSQKAKSTAVADLLSMGDDVPAVPTDFSKSIDRTELPAQLAFDTRNCEKQPLPAAVAAGIVQPRAAPGEGASLLQDLSFDGAATAELGGIDPALMSTVQALAAQSQVSPEQLIRAAQQLALQSAQAGEVATTAPPPLAMQPPAQMASAGYPAVAQNGFPQTLPDSAAPKTGMDAFEALDPLAVAGGARNPPSTAPLPASPGSSGDRFGDLLALAGGAGLQPQGSKPPV